MGNKYIYNRHIAPVTVHARDKKGAVLFTKTFQPERSDGTTGRVVSTGYTTLTDEEYGLLREGSRTFTHYKDKLKLLELHEDLPPDAKTPQEALGDARRKEREARDRVSALEAENQKLKAGLHDAEEKIGQLVSASAPEEVLKPLEAKIASLEKDLAVAKAESGKLKEVFEKGAERTDAEKEALQTALKNVTAELKEAKSALKKAGSGEKDFE